jgi:hypothetical protein
MDMQALTADLLAAGIPRDVFRVGTVSASDNDVFCLERTKTGFFWRWITYYAERGGQFEISIFETEDAACQHFYTWLLNLKRRGAFAAT